MRIKKNQLLSGDITDLHGDTMTLDNLRSMRDGINNNISSSYLEHDYRNPPIGRISTARITNNGKNNLLVGDFEYFDINDVNKQNPIKKKELLINNQGDTTHINIGFDRSYQSDEQIEELKKIQLLIDKQGKLKYDLKKSLGPQSCLTLLGVVVIGGILTGFFNKIGSDIWDKLKEVFDKNKARDKILLLDIIVKNVDGKELEVLVNISNPNFPNMESFKKIIAQKIEEKISAYNIENKPVRKITFNINHETITHAYSIFPDGTPFDINDMELYGQFLSRV